MKKLIACIISLVMLLSFAWSVCAFADTSDRPDGFDVLSMSWKETPESTAIDSIAYDSKYHVLGIIFKSNTSRAYLYYDVPKSEWDGLRKADSTGGYYNSNIKGLYPSERIDLLDLEMQEYEQTAKRNDAHGKFVITAVCIIVGGVIIFCIYTKIDETRMTMVEEHEKKRQ